MWEAAVDASEPVCGIAPKTVVGVVTLHVADVNTMSTYYASAFLMEVLDEKVQVVTLFMS